MIYEAICPVSVADPTIATSCLFSSKGWCIWAWFPPLPNWSKWSRNPSQPWGEAPCWTSYLSQIFCLAGHFWVLWGPGPVYAVPLQGLRLQASVTTSLFLTFYIPDPTSNTTTPGLYVDAIACSLDSWEFCCASRRTQANSNSWLPILIWVTILGH